MLPMLRRAPPCCAHLEASLADADLGVDGAVAHIVVPAENKQGARGRVSIAAAGKWHVLPLGLAHLRSTLRWKQTKRLHSLPCSHVHKAHPKRQVVARQVPCGRLCQQLACRAHRGRRFGGGYWVVVRGRRCRPGSCLRCVQLKGSLTTQQEATQQQATQQEATQQEEQGSARQGPGPHTTELAPLTPMPTARRLTGGHAHAPLALARCLDGLCRVGQRAGLLPQRAVAVCQPAAVGRRVGWVDGAARRVWAPVEDIAAAGRATAAQNTG